MRLFVAIRFDEEILRALADFQARMEACEVRGYYATEENLHLTLAFIGEYGDPDAVLDAMEAAAFSPFDLRLDGMGTFRDLYWVGLSRSGALFGYTKRLRRALAERDIPYDRKRFSPHITVLRRASWDGAGLPPVTPPTGEMEVRRVSLMRSERGKHGMIYTEIGKIGEE